MINAVVGPLAGTMLVLGSAGALVVCEMWLSDRKLSPRSRASQGRRPEENQFPGSIGRDDDR